VAQSIGIMMSTTTNTFVSITITTTTTTTSTTTTTTYYCTTIGRMEGRKLILPPLLSVAWKSREVVVVVVVVIVVVVVAVIVANVYIYIYIYIYFIVVLYVFCCKSFCYGKLSLDIPHGFLRTRVGSVPQYPSCNASVIHISAWIPSHTCAKFEIMSSFDPFSISER
jgi:hypothetical protein